MKDKLLRVQAELKANKSQFNKFGNYNYRSCEDILEAVKPLLNREGLLMTISDEVVNILDRIYVMAHVVITDGDKQMEVSALAREPVEQKGMSSAQITGSASSYARKYALSGMYLIDDTKDDDTKDNSNHTASPSKTEQVKDTFKAVPVFDRDHAISEIEKAMEAMKYPMTEKSVVRDLMGTASNKEQFTNIYKSIMKGSK